MAVARPDNGAHEGSTHYAHQGQPRVSSAQLGLGGREGQGRGASMNLEERESAAGRGEYCPTKGAFGQYTARFQEPPSFINLSQ